MEKKTIKEISIDSQMIYQRLIKMEPGQSISYDELSEIIGRDIQVYGRYNLYTATRMALRDESMVFESIRNQGIRRLKNDEIPHIIGSSAIGKIRKISKVNSKKIIAVDYDALSNDSKVKHNMALSVLGAFLTMTKTKSITMIEETINLNEMNRLTYAKTLESFKKA